MRYLVINTVAGTGSTGKIAADICRKLTREGHEAVLAYARDKANCDDIRTVKIGNMLDVYWHVAMTRLFDKHGLCSKHATKQFLKWVDDYAPEVIWLHNIHGYYINYEELFEYIKHYNITVKWTLHDCWALTGHCSYFTYVKCEQWKDHCSCCPQKRAYPSCLTNGKVDNNFNRKKKAFTGVKDMEIIVPSKWLKNLVGESYLKDYPCTVVYNEIDRNIFKPTPSDFRKVFHLEDKKIVLGVASVWSQRKGLEDFYELASMLDDKYVIVLVGLTESQAASLPRKVVGLNLSETYIEYPSIHNSVKYFENFYAGSQLFHKNNFTNIGITEVSEKKTGKVVPQNVYAIYKAITGDEFTPTRRKSGASVIVVERTENQIQLAQLYSAADFFVNPTYEDNYPTVNLEAIACGCYVVTYDTGGCSETLDSGKVL